MQHLLASSFAAFLPVPGAAVRCGRCNSVMAHVRSETGVRSIQAWYDCPVCHQRSLLSEPLGAAPSLGPVYRTAAPARAAGGPH